MSTTTHTPLPDAFPLHRRLLAALELLKPVTWFAPMWAFACGVISTGASVQQNLTMLIGGMILCGPLVCATSQAANDWFDRHVDAINEPDRPIPSGRIPGRWGLNIAIIWSVLSLVVASMLGLWVFAAAAVGLFLAWIYSAPPLRLKMNGWLGAAAVGACYEGLPWFTGAAVMVGGLPDWRILSLAALYSIGALGIMTLNDFKAVVGDAQLGIRSLPVQLGVRTAAILACAVMVAPQLLVATLLFDQGTPLYALAVMALLIAQLVAMPRLLRDPAKYAPWYNATGTSLYVLGMMVSAFALRAMVLEGV